ncbi:MAG: recombinase family protein, partial [Clostridia bacterium]
MNYIDKSTQITEGLRKSFQTMDCKMANRICYGYIIAADGELTINEVEAKIVHWIFERYLNGDSFGKIAIVLEKQGVLSPTGKAK